MSRRSKVVLIILVAIIILLLISVLNQEPSTDAKLDQWEEEIVDPNNNLDLLESDDKTGDLVLGVAQKIEYFISKFFSFILGLFDGFLS